MIETVQDGVELSGEFLDDLFVSIRDKVPAGKWVPITKDHERVVAGIRHIIDCRCYGVTEWDVVFNNEFTHFRKTEYPKKQPSPFEGMYLTDHPASYWTQQDELALERQKREYLKAQRAEKHEAQRARTYKKSRKRK